jgi:hypothetical protein
MFVDIYAIVHKVKANTQGKNCGNCLFGKP